MVPTLRPRLTPPKAKKPNEAKKTKTLPKKPPPKPKPGNKPVALKNRLQRVSSSPKQPPSACGICHFVRPSQTEMKTHTCRRLEEQYKCRNCKKRFQWKLDKKAHQNHCIKKVTRQVGRRMDLRHPRRYEEPEFQSSEYEPGDESLSEKEKNETTPFRMNESGCLVRSEKMQLQQTTTEAVAALPEAEPLIVQDQPGQLPVIQLSEAEVYCPDPYQTAFDGYFSNTEFDVDMETSTDLSTKEMLLTDHETMELLNGYSNTSSEAVEALRPYGSDTQASFDLLPDETCFTPADVNALINGYNPNYGMCLEFHGMEARFLEFEKRIDSLEKKVAQMQVAKKLIEKPAKNRAKAIHPMHFVR